MSSVHPSALIQPQSVQSHLLHSRLLGCEQHQPWPYTWGGWLPTPSYVMGRGQFQNTSLVICGAIPCRCHICQGVILFLWLGGEAVLVLSPSPSSSPKILLPQVSQELSQSALQQFKDFPGPSLVPSQNAPTPDDHSVYRQRCWAASKKIGSSADSKIKSSQSMKSALITLHT